MINIYNKEEVKKLDLKALAQDAKERKDKAAFNWLKEQAVTSIIRTKDNGESFTVAKPVNLIRTEYLKKYYPDYNKKKRIISTMASRVAMFDEMESDFEMIS